jgi:iron-sulfur cluster assembly accessory protein
MATHDNQITPVAITDSARKHIEGFLQSNKSAIGFRLGVKKSGCTGFSYVADIATDIKADEQQFTINGINVLMDEQGINALRNTEIDLVDKGLGQKQLVFNNPNIKHSCGCGESFSVEN